MFLVSDSKTGSTRGQKASVTWTTKDKSGDPPEFECSCGVPEKMQLPCSHVIATVTGEKSYF